jgi:hypothetical protein
VVYDLTISKGGNGRPAPRDRSPAMHINIAVHVEPLTYEFQTSRGTRKVSTDHQGRFEFKYRGESFYGHDPVAIQKEMREHDVWADQEKADKAAAKAAAEATAATADEPTAPAQPAGPVFALRRLGTGAELERIEVRGWSQRGNRQDKVNVTLADGKKDVLETNSLLADLTGEQRATYVQLVEQRDAASAAEVAARPAPKRGGYYDGEVHVSYDLTAHHWVARITQPAELVAQLEESDETEGATYAGETPYYAQEAARLAIGAHLTPWSVLNNHDGEAKVVRTADLSTLRSGSGVRFTTQEAAQAYADTVKAAAATRAAYWDFTRAHQFDTALVP